jgi:hypothetical protein
MAVTARQVVEALKQRYVTGDPGTANVSSVDVAEFLRQCPADELQSDNNLTLLIAAGQPDWILSASDLAVISSVRDCMTMIFGLIDLDDKVETHLRGTTPILAVELLLVPELPLAESPSSVLTILDLLLDATIGWSGDQGRSGEQLLSKLSSTLDSLRSEKTDYAEIQADLTAFLEKEQKRIVKLEERLAASESGKLRSQRGRAIAADTINVAMEGQKLTSGIAHFLKGPWFESLQLLAITKGVDSDEWIRATKLTETIIWTYQPTKDETEKQRLYRIVEHLPSEIRDLTLALEHNVDESEAALAGIEEDHLLMVSGQELEYEDVEPLNVEGQVLDQHTSVSKILLRKVNNLKLGQWFTFNDGDKSARIKLVLKLEDVKQMMFTNRNGMKALEKSFDEMAYLMSSGVIKALNHESIFSSTFSSFYQGLIDEHDRKIKLAEEADQEEAEREAARTKALKEAEALARAREEEERQRKEEDKANRLERAKTEASKSENQEKLAEIAEVVSQLNIGAWLKLPAADGELEECKLAVRVASADKMIFVSRTGVKVGDYSAEQLVSLLVAGEAVIEDSGVEFEDTLAQVVSKLRQDRNKSYDDLTGG